MAQTLIVNLPFFPGFYESILSQTLDYAVERESEYQVERESSKEYYPDEYWPDELRLDHSELWDSVCYSTTYEAMARDYAESFDRWMNDNFDTAIGSFTFESMTSPRYYNFETDRLFVNVHLDVMQSLADKVDLAKLSETIEERHKSRSGFISFYSDSLADWQEKLEDGLETLDHNELATILCAAIADKVKDESRYGDGFNWTLCESIFEHDYVYLDQHCDWQGYADKCQQWRAEKLASLIADDPDQAARLIAGCDKVAALESLAVDELDDATRKAWQGREDSKPYRCPVTQDLFEGEGNAA
jgi:hypothetical protein